MENNIWERFDEIAPVEEVMEAKSQFEPIEVGTHRMRLESIEPSTSKSGLPMLKAKFRLTENNRILFLNQMLQNLNYPKMTARNIADAISLVGQLIGEDLDYEELGGLAKFAELITQIPIGGEYLIDVSYGPKDLDKSFPKIRVVEDVDELLEEDVADNFVDDDVPLPF